MFTDVYFIKYNFYPIKRGLPTIETDTPKFVFNCPKMSKMFQLS